MTFREAIDYRRSRAKTPPEPFSRFSPDELDRVTYCPSCQKKMETFEYYGPGNIVIDTCNSCDLIWLDYGELRKVVNAPGRDRGVPRPKPSENDQEEGGSESGNQIKTSFMNLLSTILDELFED
jgi:Zn-finger nucleic acid-binding protein